MLFLVKYEKYMWDIFAFYGFYLSAFHGKTVPSAERKKFSLKKDSAYAKSFSGGSGGIRTHEPVKAT